MKEEILSLVRPHVFRDTVTKVSSMLDQYRTEMEKSRSENDDLLRDQVEHLLRALTMISEVPETVEGATMAKGIAKEALSALR
jgi:hypothetical protein